MHSASPAQRKYSTQVFLIVSSILLLSLTSSSYAANQWVRTDLAKASNKHSNNEYAFDSCRELQAKPFDENSNKKKLIIVGDSQGCDFLNAVLENNYFNNYQIRFRFIPYSCQRIPGDHISKYIEPKHLQFCLHSGRADNLKDAKKQVRDADLVIFAELWKKEVAKRLPQTFRYLGITKHQRVVVIGNKFFGKMKIRNYIHMTDKKLRKLRNDVGTKTQDINSILKKVVSKKALFIDPHLLLCGDSTSCPVFTNRLRLISYDGRHLTKEGARYYGRVLFQRTRLGNI